MNGPMRGPFDDYFGSAPRDEEERPAADSGADTPEVEQAP